MAYAEVFILKEILGELMNEPDTTRKGRSDKGKRRTNYRKRVVAK